MMAIPVRIPIAIGGTGTSAAIFRPIKRIRRFGPGTFVVELQPGDFPTGVVATFVDLIYTVPVTLGGTRLLVDEIDAEHARRVLRELDAGGYALDADATPDATLQTPDRESWSSRLAWIALMLFNIPLPWRRKPRSDDEAVREM